MKSKFFIISLLILMTLFLFGCAKQMGEVLGAGYTYQTAKMKLDDAEMKRIEGKTKEAKKLTDQALELFLQIVETEKPDNKYFSRAHYQIAGIYMSRFDWDNAIKHYQAVVNAQAYADLIEKAKEQLRKLEKSTQ